MKKIMAITLSVILLFCVSGCKNDTETGKTKVLIGSGLGYTGAEGEYIGALNEVEELGKGFSESFEQYEKKGEVKTVNLFNSAIGTEFDRVDRLGRSRTIRINYRSGEEKGFYSYDAETGKIIDFLFGRSDDGSIIFPEGYEVKTTPGKLEEVEKDAQEIVKKYVDETIDLKEYEANHQRVPDEDGGYFDILYIKYINNVKVHYISFTADEYGNIYLFMTEDQTGNGKVEVPDLKDEVYIDGAKERIEEFYKGNENVAEIKDYEVTYKILVYLPMNDTDAIDYGVDYTLVYKDGTERKTGNQFYYLLNQK